MDPCPFCSILSGERAYTIVERGPKTSVLVTHEQRGTAHLLVIPNKHRPTLMDLLGEEAAALMDAVVRASRAIVAAYDPAGIGMWMNNGTAANQTVPHVHAHVAGTWPNGTMTWGAVDATPPETLEAIASALRPHLATDVA
jgi:histidine triad (HIT) family protein